MVGRAVCQQHEFVTPLAQHQKQRQQRGAEHEPVADRHVDRRAAGHRAQCEARGNRQRVDNHDVLQERRVGEQQRQIAGRRGQERQTQRVGHDQRAEREHGCGGERRVDAERPRRDRPLRLQRMAAVLFSIEHVIDEVHGAGQRAKHEEGDHRTN